MGCLYAQESENFKEEVASITKKYDSLWNASKETIVFTGSSSIRLWADLQERFPNHQILNTGFGGSQAYDLLVHLDDLVLKYRPKKVFIYEGDNDISDKKRPRQILSVFNDIVTRIHSTNPNTEIVLISTKPSIARWKFKGRYRRLNRRLEKWANKNEHLYYADVWSVMLNGRKLNRTLFIEDGLHMNPSGYELWYQALKTYVE